MALSSTLAARQPIYAPVDAANKEFRLLRILPGIAPSMVQCLLTKECMPDAPAFAALSYTWGQPDPNCHIEVNSNSLRVTKNLLRFLLQVRQMPSYADKFFWIDAICVDQGNIKERGEQVALMSSIYSSAAVVVLWLGPAYEDSDFAMRVLARTDTTTHTQSTKHGKIWRNREGAAIRQLCERRYWTRLWVLQELALAYGKISIVCGGKQLRWADFTSRIVHVRPPLFSKKAELDYTYDRVMKSPGRAMSIQVIQTSAESLLYDQVLAARHLKCLDPRDKVYGVLGIAKDTPLGRIRADYDFSLVQVAHQVIQRDLSARPAASLDDVRQRAQELAGIFGVSMADMLSTRELLPAAVTEYPLPDEETGIDLLWACKLKLWDVVKFWVSKRGIGLIETALEIAIDKQATGVIEAITGLWREFSFAVNKPGPTQLYAAQCGRFKEFLTFRVGSPPKCLACEPSCKPRPLREFGQVNLPALHQAILGRCKGYILMVLATYMDNEYLCLEGTEIVPPALHVAASMGDGDLEILQLLMQRTDVNQRSACSDKLLTSSGVRFRSGDTPLLAASRFMGRRTVRALLANTRTNVNLRDESGNTALYYCMLYDVFLHSEGLALLELEDYNSHTVYQHGRTLLHLAAWFASSEDENLAITQRLLEKGLKVNAREQYGCTPLHWASRSSSSLSLHEYSGAEVKALYDEYGHSIHRVADFDKTGAIALLIENGADVTARDNKMMTPLHYLADSSRGHMDNEAAMKIMVQHGADVNAVDKEGKTPLHYCTRGGTRAVNILLGLGADPHIRDLSYKKPGEHVPCFDPVEADTYYDTRKIYNLVGKEWEVVGRNLKWTAEEVKDFHEGRQLLVEAKRESHDSQYRRPSWYVHWFPRKP